MSIEFYAKQPPKLEVFALPDGDTDIILRRKITEIPQEDDDGDPNASCWQCEEIQIRQQGKITFSEVEERFDLLWGEETVLLPELWEQPYRIFWQEQLYGFCRHW